MGITLIKVTKENIYDIITDPHVYVIKKDRLWNPGSYRMYNISECDVKELMSDKVQILKIED